MVNEPTCEQRDPYRMSYAPCGKPAIGIAVHPGGPPWPVCADHARHLMHTVELRPLGGSTR